MSALLSAESVSKVYGGVHAVEAVTAQITEHEILGLIGPNGAGKTTLFNVLSGFTPASAGRVSWRGEDITTMRPHARARLGIVRTFQHSRVFPKLTVRENILAATHCLSSSSLFTEFFGLGRARRADREAQQRADQLVSDFGFDAIANVGASELAYGLGKRVGLAMAVAADPKLLMLDEPAAGLNHGEVSVLRDDLNALRAKGMTIWVVEHHMGLIMSVCDRVLVIRSGRKIADDRPDVVSKDPAVIEAYLGAPT